MEPPATHEDMQAAALQFIRKVSGFRKPSRANEAAFQKAVDDVTQAAERLLNHLSAAGDPASRKPAGNEIRG